MNLPQIYDGLTAGTMTFNLYGHLPARALERLLQAIQRDIKGAAGGLDGKWNMDRNDKKTMEELNADMRDFFQRAISREYRPGELMLWTDHPEYECQGCGVHMKLVCVNDNEIALKGYYDRKANDFVQHEAGFLCPFRDPKPTTGSIKIPSGIFVFGNFFNHIDDAPEGKRYGDIYELSSRQGRQAITDFKAENGIAYGQTTNTSVGVYVHPNKDSILIAETYLADGYFENLSDEEYKALSTADKKRLKKELSEPEGHKLKGQFSCGVWRWEGTDSKNVPQASLDLLVEQCNPAIKVKVKKGRWQFEHQHELPRDQHIWARLKLTDTN